MVKNKQMPGTFLFISDWERAIQKALAEVFAEEINQQVDRMGILFKPNGHKEI
jgi:hypothetical protein